MAELAAQVIPTISQEELDISSKERSNLFPWRGQFSPQLIESILSTYAHAGETVFDPFAGVGTSLIEAAKLGIHGRGTELNPSAYLMAQAVEWVRLRYQDREQIFVKAEKIVLRESSVDPLKTASRLADLVRNRTLDLYTSHVIANTVMRLMNGENNHLRALLQHCSIIRSLPYSSCSQRMFHSDARATPLAPESAHLVVTSPPYINVFNYHENNRKAMELLGWDILSVARAEVGSNRKHRGNRFLTVIQYCLDMKLAFEEMRRILVRKGQAIIIVGRESKVRGVSFENGLLLRRIAVLCGFEIGLSQERKFTNRFGQTIYEDILHLIPVDERSEESALAVATCMLAQKLSEGYARDVCEDLNSAIEESSEVRPSPIFDTQIL